MDYAYETRKKFPDAGSFSRARSSTTRTSMQRLARWASCSSSITSSPNEASFDFSVISRRRRGDHPRVRCHHRGLPRLRAIGCVMVDTTCGSVLNVWKRVESYARDGFTALIHGKHYHEETKATACQVRTPSRRQYLIVLDMAEARLVCEFIEGQRRCGRDSRAVRRRDVAGVRFQRAIWRASASRTRRRCSRARSLAIAAEFRAVDWRALRRGSRRRAFPLVRHHLLGDAGTAGRRDRAARANRST